MMFSFPYIDVDYGGILISIALDVLDINMNTLLPYLQGHYLVTFDEEYYLRSTRYSPQENLKPL